MHPVFDKPRLKGEGARCGRPVSSSSTTGVPMTTIADEVRVIDADTHLTEAHDLWIKRAPAAYKDRVPRVEEVDGRPTWVVDGVSLGFAGGGGVVDRDGGKHPFQESMVVWGIDRVHQGAYDTKVRL